MSSSDSASLVSRCGSPRPAVEHSARHACSEPLSDKSSSNCLCKKYLTQNEEELRKRTYGHYVEDLAREERVLVFEEEMYYQQNPHRRDRTILQYQKHHTEPSYSADHLLANLNKLYRSPRPAVDTPMERFMTLSTANDPHRLLAREEMKERGIGQGAMDNLERRRPALGPIETEALPEGERKSAERMTLHYRTRYNVSADSVRTIKPVKLRRRRNQKEEQKK